MDNRETSLGSAVALDVRCLQIGQLICKEAGYALRVENSVDIWLEMDRIPLHLIEQQVKVEGLWHGRGLILVDAIGPT